MIRQLGQRDYATVFKRMREYSDTRDAHSADEIWVVEHPPVFTQGQAGKAEHLLMPGDIPVVASDRGGQVTYHGPGQAVVYVLFDLKRMGIGPKSLVNGIEQALIDYLAEFDIQAERKSGAPGVYVNEKKIASLGLRIRRGCSYHGLSLNINMDLQPFSRINPCGYAGLEMTQMRDFGHTPDIMTAGRALADKLEDRFALYAAPGEDIEISQ